MEEKLAYQREKGGSVMPRAHANLKPALIQVYTNHLKNGTLLERSTPTSELKSADVFVFDVYGCVDRQRVLSFVQSFALFCKLVAVWLISK